MCKSKISIFLYVTILANFSCSFEQIDREDELIAKIPLKFPVAATSQEFLDRESGQTTRMSFGWTKYDNLGLSSSEWRTFGNKLEYNGTLELKSSDFGIWFEQRKTSKVGTLSLFSGEISYTQPILNLYLDMSIEGPFLYFDDLQGAQFNHFSLTGLNLNDVTWSIETAHRQDQSQRKETERRGRGQWMIQAAEKVKQNFYARQEDAIATQIMDSLINGLSIFH